MPPKPATGQSVNIKRIGDGLDLNIDDDGNLVVSVSIEDVVVSSGDTVITSPNNAINAKRIWVTNTPQQILTVVTGRSRLRIKNISSEDFYIGVDNSVSSGDGYPIFAQTHEDFDFGPLIQPYIVKPAAGSGDCRLLELG